MSLVAEPKRPRMVVFLVCLTINSIVLLVVSTRNPEYLRDYRAAGTKDGKSYVRLGENVYLRGEYSRLSEPPYVPDMNRPPLYALLAGGLYLLSGAGAIYIVQAVFHALSCVLLFEIGVLCFSQRAGFWAALLLGANFIFINANFEPLSEITFTLLVLAGLWLILGPLTTKCWGRSAALQSALGGLCLGLSIITRPAGLYLPLVCVVVVAIGSFGSRKPMQAWICPVLIALMSYLPAAAWMARNQHVFGVPRLTSTDAGMSVYYLGTGAYQIHHGISRQQAEEMICAEYDLPSNSDLHNCDVYGGDLREMYYQVKSAARPVLMKYPAATLCAGAIGIAKALGSHTGSSLAGAFAMEWNPPGFGQLIKGDSNAWKTFFSNPVVLWAIVAWELALSAGGILFAFVGALIMMRRPYSHNLGAWLLLLVAAYFCAMPALSAFVASCRAAIPAWPFILLLAAFALDRMWKKYPKVEKIKNGTY